jgi:hypothetical protein
MVLKFMYLRLREVQADSGNIAVYARLEALGRACPRGPTPTASEALAGAGQTGGHHTLEAQGS